MERGSFGRVVVGSVVTTLALTGCQLKNGGEDLVNGKQQFVTNCAACHTLARAGASGVTGPNLDEAFRQSRADGMKDSTFAGIVEGQIAHPNRNAQVDPATGKELPLMKPGIVTGEDARDVAAYVASAVAEPGEDTGPLAAVGASKAEGTATEQGGTLDIPVAASGLAYKFADATATAGQVTVKSENPQPTQHDIAIEGNGVNEKGEVVTSGGVSQFSADLKPGTYTFFCSVPGHREGGMEGKLTVK
ncbi:c-type cytochrome [Solirubrobacter ginsenosidimutans]|uniref:C-type cytochrome n=1 Tax=Solirubrobacter ginsenosidimutans TaxID=490573 RepID=A0A9X3S4D4_9ACTN|nr:c-type cytochrome [Solirubrobacter ginsenosidimutans]MDA0160513.1 c-type cytochrome [Solirubrobacter ginsenosidimutans]